jgi:hypothetical protein
MTKLLFPKEIFEPPIIEKLKLQDSSFYEILTKTFDEEGNFHSYDDKPATSNNISWDWHKNGKRHRDNGQPAILYKNNPEHFHFFENDQTHRLNNLPAHSMGDRVHWYVRGDLHRTNGPSILSFSTNTREVSEGYALYGLLITKRQFVEVKSIAEQNSCPIWMATLQALKVLRINELNSIIELSNESLTPLPFNWIARAFSLEKRLDNLYERQPFNSHGYETSHMLSGFARFQIVVNEELKS